MSHELLQSGHSQNYQGSVFRQSTVGSDDGSDVRQFRGASNYDGGELRGPTRANYIGNSLPLAEPPYTLSYKRERLER